MSIITTYDKNVSINTKMNTEKIRHLMKEVIELRASNAILEAKCARLLSLGKKAQERQDYWRERYYSKIHHTERDMPDATKDVIDFLKGWGCFDE